MKTPTYIATLFFVLLACTKVNDAAEQLSRRGGIKGKPPKDTVVVPPPPVDSIPESYRIPGVPAIGNQGGEGSCVAFTVGYYAHSVYTGKLMSPEYLYNATKLTESCQSGSALITSMNFLVNNGGVEWYKAPYSGSNGCAKINIPGEYKVPGYAMVLSSDTTGIKKAILKNKVVMMTATYDHGMHTSYPGYTWYFHLPPAYGPHSFSIIGYDKRGFILALQYGPTWGDSGLLWVDKASLKALTYDLYYFL